MTISAKRILAHPVLPLLVLTGAVFAVYGVFLDNPFVFDDLSFFEVAHPQYMQQWVSLSLRWIPYATFEWTRHWVGDDLAVLRTGNLCLHAANGYLLFLFLRRLFDAVATNTKPLAAEQGLPGDWLALAGAMWFVWSPAAVYGAGYLVQRTILMATLFSLVAALLFLVGLQRNDRRWMWVSVLAYLLAGLSKEHAVMVPAVVMALLLLLRKPSWALVRQLAPVGMGYAIVGAFIVFQVLSGSVIAHAYEPNSIKMLDGIDPRYYYPLSVLTQSNLFFKYLMLWLVPNTAWMAIDMREDFVRHFWQWPETAGFIAFVLYGVGAVVLLLKRGRTGLLGFAMLSPWLLFATEMSTVRIQEIFVIYRSYLWMPWIAAAFPCLFHRVPKLPAALVLVVGIAALAPLSWQRLHTFSDPIVLWDESLQLAQHSLRPTGMGRLYHNRGVAYLNAGRYDEAILDFDRGLRFLPSYSALYNDRAVAYLQTQRYFEALHDYNIAIWLNPNYYNPYLGRAKVHEALGHAELAVRDYAMACKLGVDEVCTQK